MIRKTPERLPLGLLAAFARRRKFLLCLDYDGTVAEIVTERMKAYPYIGIDSALRRLCEHSENLKIAIVTGRRIAEVRTLLEPVPELLFSGVHGLEFDTDNSSVRFTSEALACANELALVRHWLQRNVVPGCGFAVEDKEVALALHYRSASPLDAAILCDRLASFVTDNLARLKLMRLKKVLEVIPAIAGKSYAVADLKRHLPSDWATVYLGDDETDEDAFAALGGSDLGILVGPTRSTFARYRLDDPSMVAKELHSLADAIA